MALKAPTPPTPPVIDKGDVQTSTPRIDAHQFFEIPQMPFSEGRGNREQGTVENSVVAENPTPTTRKETTPEDMARDAVANGAGTLSKRTVTRADDENISDTPPSQVQSTTPISSVPIQSTTNSSSNSYERGQSVLREFRDEDRRVDETFTENSTSTPTPTYNRVPYQESHGGLFWIVTLIFVVVATFVVAKKFLFRSKPALKKSDLFERPSESLKATAEKFSSQPKTSTQPKPTKKATPPKPTEKVPPVKPARLPKKDDDKGTHFEVRI